MKTFLLIVRWVVGLLFIFSGLIKANDPLGLSYKMQEFFEVWGWDALNAYTLSFALLMNLFEVVAGVAVIIGWRMKLVSRLLLSLIVFFTFLTGYALFSGKIKTCGCFGDCIPLTAAQSFGKDIFLLILILVLLVTGKRIHSSFKSFTAIVWLLIVTAGTSVGQWYVLAHLPIVDCLPYKKGNDIAEQMKTPAGAVPDSFSIVFTYQKNGRQLSFDQSNFPADFDSTYTFIDRKDKLVKKGNGLQAKIIDFSLQTLSGIDTTAAVFAQPNPYLLVMANHMENTDDWISGFAKVVPAARQKHLPIILVTADADKAVTLFPNTIIVKCDATVIKTAARVTPTYFLMQQSIVLDKISYVDLDKILRKINSLK